MNTSSPRTRILDVASRLFYEQGYNSTGINQIIEEAEIARASLYNHFPSKTDLLKAYLQEAEESWFISLETFLAPIKDPKKKLLALFDFRIERQSRLNFGGCQFIKISAEVSGDNSEVFDLVTHQKTRLKLYIKNLVKQLDRKNPMIPGEMLTETLFLLMEGATVATSIYKDTAAIKKAKKIAEKLI